MTYVTRDGRVLPSQPWGIAKVMGLFWGFIDLIVAYFQTLISPWTQSDKPANNFGGGGAWRGSGGGGGGGGGGGFFRGGGGGGGGGPRGPPKPPPGGTSTE
uniref:Glycine-rich selenoprotein n=1 Tax=Lygus hesperus TaxID=30085 RepID=A0A0A9Y5L2_LYGHE